MKPDDQQLSSLFDEVMTSESTVHAGVDRAEVLRLVRQERSRRQRVRVSLGLAAVVLLAVLIFQQPQTPEPKTRVATVPPRPSLIRQVNDQQLLGLLDNTPAALIEWPDGGRTLLVLNPQK